MLRLAAREADIVHVNYNLNEGRINPKLVRTGLAEATDEKLEWIREAAGDRLEAIELGFTVFFASVTDDRESIASAMAPSMGFELRDVLEMPHFLIGTLEQIEEDLKARRERYGFSDVIVPGDAADSLAPVVERLAGR
jgi:alkanesulfonate monooxygenase SsuD/methylene tetrahydromethanopterin reductase-like flavin-dependent oxidoreductase (luciferase family)